MLRIFFKSSPFGELLKKEARIDRARQVDELQIRLDEGVFCRKVT